MLGTRPEIIKLSPVIKEMIKTTKKCSVIHTGQHYSYKMDSIFFEELNLPPPNKNLNVGSGTHAYQTGEIMKRLEAELVRGEYDKVVVQGDTTSAMSAALTASKLNIPVHHVEAGLRCYDKIPEETNRIIIDHISDVLYAPTQLSKANIKKEGINEKKIMVTGNTIVDALLQNKKQISKSEIVKDLGIDNYVLTTFHRQENVDNPERLKGIIQGLNLIKQKYDVQIVFPQHPRTKKMMKKFDLKTKDWKIIEPVGYFDFLGLVKNAEVTLSDSGGLAEESAILKVPNVILRNSTERPEAVSVGASILAGANPIKILKSYEKMILSKKKWENPFGDGKASKRIVEGITKGVHLL